jgi:hypothetical protein
MSTKLGKYSDSGKGNVLADDRLMSEGKENYGGYEKYSIGRTVNQKPNPGVQNRGNVQNGD